MTDTTKVVIGALMLLAILGPMAGILAFQMWKARGNRRP